MKFTKFASLFASVVVAIAICTVFGILQSARATALSDNRDTPYRSGEYVSMTVASGAVIYAGAMVCENGSTYAVPALDSSGFIVIGRAEAKADNSTANYSATKTVKVRRGVFLWANGDSFTDANIGDYAYVEDDQTVQKGSSATQDVVAGVIIDVDDDGVWVDTYAIGGSGAASFTTVSASGAATLSSTLDVSGNTTVGGTLGVTGASTVAALSASGNVGVGGTLKVTGAVTASNNLTVTKSLVLVPETLTLTAGAFTLTPTQAVYFIAGQYGVVTMTLANATASGMPLTFINTVATNVVLEDSAANLTTMPSGYTTWTNGQYDGMEYVSSGTNWYFKSTIVGN